MASDEPREPQGNPDPPSAEQAGRMKRDESWKNAAQKEKEKLEENLQSAPRRELPRPDFSQLLYDLSIQAMLSMGMVASHEQEEPIIDLPVARYTIDMISVLEEKTKGNLSEEEAAYLKQLLQSLRMRFVEVSRHVAQNIAQNIAQAADPKVHTTPPKENSPPKGKIII